MPTRNQSYTSKTGSCLRRRVGRTLSGIPFIIAVLLSECVSSIPAIGASSPSPFVQQASGAAHGNRSSLTLTFPANTLAGDLLLVAFEYAKGATPSAVTDSQGNAFTSVKTRFSAPGGAIRSVYSAKNIKGGPDKVTITLSAASSHLDARLREYSGSKPINPIYAQAGAPGTACAVSSGEATTTEAGDIIGGLCAADWACTAGSDFAPRPTSNSQLVEDMTARSPGQQTMKETPHFGRVISMAVLQSDLLTSTGVPVGSGAPPTPPPPSPPPPSPSAEVSLSTTSLTFGSIPIGQTSTPQVVTVTNAGSVNLNISGIDLTGADPTDFSEATTCGTGLAAGDSCTVVVLYTPLTSGTHTASLTVTDNAPDSPQRVSLSGGGGHDVVVTWTDSVTPGVLGYYVYRGTASGEESTTPLNSTPVAGTSYADSDVTSGQTYYYVVTALGSKGTAQSSDSTEASATVP